MIGAVGEARAVELRAGQHVVLVGRIAAAVVLHAFLVQRVLQAQLVVVAVQIGNVLRYLHALGVVPGAGADAILRIECVSAEIGVPSLAALAGCGGQRLAMRVRSGQAAEIGSVAGSDAGDEEAHARVLSHGGLHGDAEQRGSKDDESLSHNARSLLGIGGASGRRSQPTHFTRSEPRDGICGDIQRDDSTQRGASEAPRKHRSPVRTTAICRLRR